VAICRFANPIFLLFADPIFVDLRPQIRKYIISLLKNIGLKFSISNLYKINSAEQTCGRIIGGFVVFILSVVWKKNCRFAIAICGMQHLRILRIWKSVMSPKVCGFANCGQKNKFACPPVLDRTFESNARARRGGERCKNAGRSASFGVIHAAGGHLTSTHFQVLLPGSRNFS